MKRKVTRKMPDGSMHIVEEDDEAPAHHKNELSAKQQGPDHKQQYLDRMASQGHKGDTELVHVNPWEEALLKKLGGAGTRNPHTGLKQFYTDPQDVYGWYTKDLGREPGGGGLDYWTNFAGADPYAAFQAEANKEIAARPTGWTAPTTGGISDTGTLFPGASSVLNNPVLSGAVDPDMVWGPGADSSLVDHLLNNRNVSEGNTAQAPGGINDIYAANPNAVAAANRASALTASTVVPGMGTSTNQSTGGTLSAADVTKMYQDTLGRSPTPEGLAYWTSYQGADPRASFMAEAAKETGGRTSPTAAEINQWFVTDLGRAPSPEALAYWTNYKGIDPRASFIAEANKERIAAGKTPITTPAGTTTTNTGMFDIPLNIMPTSGSTTNSTGTSTANTASSNYAGLPKEYQDALLAAIIPQLTDATKNMGANYDKYTNEALGSYQYLMQNALKKNLPQMIGALSNRGILNSTEGTNALSGVMSEAALDAGNKGYTTAMQQALLKGNMPTVLAQLADLGKSSYGTSSGTSASNNASTGTSYSQDPTVMYRTLADMIKAMM